MHRSDAEPDSATQAQSRTLRPVAWRPVLAAMAAMAVVLTVFSNGYGFHRDELYFRMLKPGWGYVDQGPFTPLVVRIFAHHVADQPWAIHLPATAIAVSSVLVMALLTREVGGDRVAQALCAWSYAFATTPLLFGHLMITSTVDLLVWPLTTLYIVRALVRSQPRWWLAAGLVVGLSMYNKLLIAMLLVAFVVGLALGGPRDALRSRWAWGGGLLALIVGAPNLVYQATHSWPELTMGQALADHNASSVRVLMWPFTIILFGPPLALVWWCGWIALWRRVEWRRVRFLAAALPVLLVLVFLAGTQFYYPSGLLAVLIAVGWVPVSEFLRRVRWSRIAMGAALAVNAAVSVTLALPVFPVADVGSTPVPGINQAARDSIGWPAYVAQVAAVYRTLPPSERRDAVVIASNYGEAGAIARYGPDLGIAAVYSPHNQLYFQSRPPARTRTVVAVGGEVPLFRREFGSCQVRARLRDGVDVDNEEQGQPVAVCRHPLAVWSVIWPALQHYD